MYVGSYTASYQDLAAPSLAHWALSPLTLSHKYLQVWHQTLPAQLVPRLSQATLAYLYQARQSVPAGVTEDPSQAGGICQSDVYHAHQDQVSRCRSSTTPAATVNPIASTIFFCFFAGCRCRTWWHIVCILVGKHLSSQPCSSDYILQHIRLQLCEWWGGVPQSLLNNQYSIYLIRCMKPLVYQGFVHCFQLHSPQHSRMSALSLSAGSAIYFSLALACPLTRQLDPT